MENNANPIEAKENKNNNNQIKQQEEAGEMQIQETKLENKIEDINEEDILLKDDYSIDEISYSKLAKSLDEEDDNSLPLKKKRKICELTQLILTDNVEEFKKIIENNKSLIKKKTLDGFSLIQYAALNGALNCFVYLHSLKVPTNEEIDGFYLIHLPLMKAIKYKYREKCILMFNYIFVTFPEQKKYKDRLGRTFLHLIFEYNLTEALNYNISIDLVDLFEEDNMGQYAINYVYIYDAHESFSSLIQSPENVYQIYLAIRTKFQESKISSLRGEEKFLENLLIYKNIRTLRVLFNYGAFHQIQIIPDFNTIFNKYLSLIDEKQDNNSDINDNDKSPAKDMIFYIQYLNQNNSFNFKYNVTAIVYNKDCINHIKLPEDDPIKHNKKKKKFYENSDRLSVLIDDDGIILDNCLFSNQMVYNNGMDGTNINNKFLISPTQRKSCLNDILKCHDIKYIKALKYKSDNIQFSKLKKKEYGDNQKPPKFWDDMNLELIEKNYFLYNDNKSTDNTDSNVDGEETILKDKKNDLYFYQQIDTDTFINQYSYQNIYNTTGCVFEAIDLIMQHNAINAFALIRPPGHHAGYYGPVENAFETTNGFCLVNNVAIGAAYAKYKYSDIIKKIAIVDIDVHHGNGTEEIVEMLNFKNFSRPFNYEKICGVKIEDKRSINWYDFDDAKNVLFISTHIYNKEKPDNYYPYSGSEENNTPKESDIYPGGIYNIPFDFKKNYPYEYKNILRTKIIPRLYKFKPDIIFVSAGFDGHKMEKINEQTMLLQENDYGYIAEQLQFVANKFCQGRLVAVLEGGYNITTGIISPFSQSVMSFIRHLNIAINMIQIGDIKFSNHKRENLFNEEMEIYKSNVKEEEEEEEKPRRSERLRHIKENEKVAKREKEMLQINEDNNKIKEEKEDKNEDIKENEIKEQKDKNDGQIEEKEKKEITEEKENDKLDEEKPKKEQFESMHDNLNQQIITDDSPKSIEPEKAKGEEKKTGNIIEKIINDEKEKDIKKEENNKGEMQKNIEINAIEDKGKEGIKSEEKQKNDNENKEKQSNQEQKIDYNKEEIKKDNN